MFFTNPAVLWFLPIIAIPIAIHLFHFRKFKKTEFSNVALLKNIQRKQQKQSKLKHILVLGCRILTIVWLILTFARPTSKQSLEQFGGEGINYVAIAIDNSFSMNLSTEQGTLLEQAKQKAEDLISKFKSSDRFALVTQDFLNDNQHFVSREEILETIEKLEIAPFSHPVSKLIERQKTMFNPISDNHKLVFLISDFQKTMTDIENFTSDTVLRTRFLPVQSKLQNNISIDSLSLETPLLQVGNEIEFKIRLTNHGEQPLQEIPVRMKVDNQIVSVGNVDLAPHQTQTVLRKLTLEKAGYLQGNIEITDHPIQFDDHLYFTLNVLEKIPVIVLSEAENNPFLMKLIRPNPSFEVQVQNVQNFDYSQLGQTNFVILDGIKTFSSGLQTELQKAIDAGTSVLIVPNEQSDMESLNQFTKNKFGAEYAPIKHENAKVDQLFSEHPIFRSAFIKLPENLLLPKVQKYFPIQTTSHSSVQTLLQLNTGTPFLAFANSGKGRIYLSSVPFDETYSDFQSQPVFVVAILNMILQSAGNNQLYNLINRQEATISNVEHPNPGEIFYLKTEEDDFEIIPKITFQGKEVICQTTEMSLKNEGNYVLQTKNKVVAKLSYNFDRLESNLQCYSQNELEQLLEQEELNGFSVFNNKAIVLDNKLFVAEFGFPLWKVCLLLALIFLLTEALILRFF